MQLLVTPEKHEQKYCKPLWLVSAISNRGTNSYWWSISRTAERANSQHDHFEFFHFKVEKIGPKVITFFLWPWSKGRATENWIIIQGIFQFSEWFQYSAILSTHTPIVGLFTICMKTYFRQAISTAPYCIFLKQLPFPPQTYIKTEKSVATLKGQLLNFIINKLIIIGP